jgi:hypothetical protein
MIPSGPGAQYSGRGSQESAPHRILAARRIACSRGSTRTEIFNTEIFNTWGQLAYTRAPFAGGSGIMKGVPWLSRKHLTH